MTPRVALGRPVNGITLAVYGIVMVTLTRLVPGLIAVALLSTAFYVHILAREVASWPTTVGRLDAKWIVGYGAGDAAEARNTNYYSVHARYSYQVDDKILTGSNVRVWNMTFSSYAGAEAYLKDNPAGSTIPVFYNPANPAQSYLSNAYPVAPVCLLLLGAVVGTGIAVFSQKLLKFLHDWFVSTGTRASEKKGDR